MSDTTPTTTPSFDINPSQTDAILQELYDEADAECFRLGEGKRRTQYLHRCAALAMSMERIAPDVAAGKWLASEPTAPPEPTLKLGSAMKSIAMREDDRQTTPPETHSPLPWKASAPDGSYHDVIRIYSESDGPDALPIAVCPQRNSPALEVLAGRTNETTEAAGNAAIIVSACNAHAKLVEALRKIKHQATAGIGCRDEGGDPGDDLLCIEDLASSALAAAGEA